MRGIFASICKVVILRAPLLLSPKKEKLENPPCPNGFPLTLKSPSKVEACRFKVKELPIPAPLSNVVDRLPSTHPSQ
jgi:hypothetical protein